MKPEKKEGKLNFTDFVDEATRHAHSELLKSGASGLRSALFLYLSSAIVYTKDNKF